MDASRGARCGDRAGCRPSRRIGWAGRAGLHAEMRTAAIRRATTVLVAATLVAHGHRTDAAAEPDPAYAAFQRGYYLTAFALATDRVETKKDVKAMTLLGELYAGGLGIRQ